MNELIRHRGPDDEGYLLIDTKKNDSILCHSRDTNEKIKGKTANINECNFEADLAVGFRRLSIIDTSPLGFQPMKDNEKNIWICFNGEIYNYIELRKELEGFGYYFSSNTDTEIILKSYLKWGFNCQNKFNGMWSFVIYDFENNLLLCSRDRYGVKPFFYYYEEGYTFVFASELKSILHKIKPEINNYYLCDLLIKGYADHNKGTFYKYISKLEPGCYIVIKNKELSIRRYYKFEISKEQNISNEKELINKFNEILFDSVRLRLRSDVQIGFALSGGIDSSSIVCTAGEIDRSNINTFSLLYENPEICESVYVQSVSKKINIKNFVICPTPFDFQKDIEDFIYYQEEPINGLSYYGEYKLRELIKDNGVTVSLEGQGADEIISGYSHYYLPYLTDVLKFEGVFKFYCLLNDLKNQIYLSRSLFFHRLFKNKFLKRKRNLDKIYDNFDYLNRDFIKEYYVFDEFEETYFSESELYNELYKDFFFKSLPIQLNRADKNSMAHSIECRFPFLDYRLVEFGFSLPYYMKIKNGTAKYILRESTKNILPENIYKRKDKIGFAVPQSNWFKNELKEFTSCIFNENSFKNADMLQYNSFLIKLDEYYRGMNSFDAKICIFITYYLINKLMFRLGDGK